MVCDAYILCAVADSKNQFIRATQVDEMVEQMLQMNDGSKTIRKAKRSLKLELKETPPAYEGLFSGRKVTASSYFFL